MSNKKFISAKANYTNKPAHVVIVYEKKLKVLSSHPKVENKKYRKAYRIKPKEKTCLETRGLSFSSINNPKLSLTDTQNKNRPQNEIKNSSDSKKTKLTLSFGIAIDSTIQSTCFLHFFNQKKKSKCKRNNIADKQDIIAIKN